MLTSFITLNSDPKPTPKISNPYPVRRSARLNKNLELNVENDLDKTPKPTPLKPKRSKTPPARTPPNSPNQSPKTPSTAVNFENEYANLNNPYSFSGNIREIANQIPTYRYVNRIKKLARRLKMSDAK